MTIPTSPDAKLRRKPAAEALTEAGYPTSPNTLATIATRGGGPPFYVFGKVAVYTWGDLLAWAQSRVSYRCATQHQEAA